MIRKLSPKDRLNFVDYCLNKRDEGLYITRKNKRLFLSNQKIAERVFNNVIKHGDKCFIADEGKIRGILLLVGFSEKSNRKYVKVVADNYRIYDGLLRMLNWEYKEELFLKVKKNNPICKLTRKYKFLFFGSRGTEILFKKSKNLYNYNKGQNNGRSNNG